MKKVARKLGNILCPSGGFIQTWAGTAYLDMLFPYIIYMSPKAENTGVSHAIEEHTD